MKSRSLWYVESNKVEVREIDVPDPGPKEVLVRTDVCGVCTWDLFIFGGGFRSSKAFPFYFGHEGIGRVAKVGPGVTSLKEGDRVAMREGRPGKIGRGHMADYVLQSEDGPVAVPEDGRPASSWMIEPTACCVNGVDLSAVKPGESVGLVGCGYMGSIILQLLALTPATKVVVFDLRPESLSYARGIAKVHDHIEVVDVKTLPKDTNAYDGAFDTTVETAATEPALRLANRSVRRGGKLIVFSWHHHDVQWDFGYWHSTGLTVINASPAAASDFDSCFRRSVPLMSTGRVSMEGLVTHIAKPEDAQTLFEEGVSKSNGYMKGVIDFGP